MKKLTSIIALIAMLALVVLPFAASADEPAGPVLPEDLVNAIKADSEAIAVNNAEEFVKMESGKSYYLAADIDLTGYVYSDKADATGVFHVPNGIFAEFSGKIDGRDHKIIGLSLKNDKKEDIGIVLDAAKNSDLVIMNLTIEEPTITASAKAADGTDAPGNSFAIVIGAKASADYTTYLSNITITKAKVTRETDVAGDAVADAGNTGVFGGYPGKTTMYNCTSDAEIRVLTSGKCNVGGFIGNARNTTTFINCTSKGTVTVGNDAKVSAVYENAAGFIGASNTSGQEVTFINCVNEANTVSYCTTNETRGAGFSAYGDATYTFTNCVNKGNVTILNGKDATSGEEVIAYGIAGGFMGSMNGGSYELKLTGCTNEGNITASQWAAGFLGENKAAISSSFAECYNKGEIKATTYAGGFIANNMYQTPCRIELCYNMKPVKDAEQSSSFVAALEKEFYLELIYSKDITNLNEIYNKADTTTAPPETTGEIKTTPKKTTTQAPTTTPAPSVTTAPAGKKSCGGISVAAQLIAVVCGGLAFAFIKKK